MYTASTFATVTNNVIGQFRPLSAFAIGLALVYFIYGLATFILNSGNEEKVAEGKKTMIWGVLALFIMISVWGLATLVSNTFQLDNTKPTVDYVNP